MAWTWDRARRVYRSTFLRLPIRNRRLLRWRDQFIGINTQDVAAITDEMINGEITRQTWERLMRENIANNMTGLYAFGRGGQNMMLPSDKQSLRDMISAQNDFLRQFSVAIRDGQLSPAQVRMRARMYMGAGTQGYSYAKSRTFGSPILPQYPGDGQTRCLSNCQCHLEYDYQEFDVLVFWVLGRAEHCPDCVALAASWSPLRLESSAGTAIKEIRDRIVEAENEHMILIDRETGELIGETEGTFDEVYPSRHIRRLMKGNTVIHNHPKPFDHIFSDRDIRAAFSGEWAEAWALTKDRAYVFRRPPDTKLGRNVVRQTFKEAQKVVWDRWESRGWIRRALSGNRFQQQEQMYRDVWNETFRRIRREYGESLEIEIIRWDGRDEGKITARSAGKRIWTD